MSTSVVAPPRSKKFNWRVRPGVLEVRARLVRPVSAFNRLDLPTLERPAKAISTAPIGGKASSWSAPKKNWHSRANKSRPASIAASLSSSSSGVAFESVAVPHRRLRLYAGAAHDRPLLGDREQVVPGPIDHQARGEVRQHDRKHDWHRH